MTTDRRPSLTIHDMRVQMRSLIRDRRAHLAHHQTPQDLTSTLDIDSERHGALLRDATIGEEVEFVVRGRVAKLEADMIDVSGYDRSDALRGRVVTTVLITEITP